MLFHSHEKKTSGVFPPSVMAAFHHRDTFDFSQGHVTKNQPMAVPV